MKYKYLIHLKYSYTWNSMGIIYILHIGTYTYTFYILKNTRKYYDYIINFKYIISNTLEVY